jgi:hypothetical protein
MITKWFWLKDNSFAYLYVDQKFNNFKEKSVSKWYKEY